MTNKLGIYVLQRRIGKGGMGAVYLAHDTTLRRPVAIKILPTELAADPEYVARFEREATSLAKIRHPNLMHIYAVGCEAGRHYIAMEYVKGVNLDELLRQRGPLPLPAAARILGQVLAALDKVHAAGVVHRDLKPANIMIDEDQRAILMDFGLAKPRYDRSVTTGNTIIGTPEYMAPELAEGHDVDSRADIYALGIVLFEMLAGQVPFRGSSAIATLRQHIEQPPPSLRKLAPDLPPKLDAILAKALAKQPERRYQDVRALAADLLAVAPTPELAALVAPAESSATTPTIPMDGAATGTAPTFVAPRSRRTWLIACAAAACLLLIAIGGSALVRYARDRRARGSMVPSGQLLGSVPYRDDPGTASATKTPAASRASQKLFAVYLSTSDRTVRKVVRGRLVRIGGEGGIIVVRTDTGDLEIPYGAALRIEPQAGE